MMTDNEIYRTYLDVDLDKPFEWRSREVLTTFVYKILNQIDMRGIKNDRLAELKKSDFLISVFEGTYRRVFWTKNEKPTKIYCSITLRNHDDWLKIALIDERTEKHFFVVQYSSKHAFDVILTLAMLSPTLFQAENV